MKAIEPGAPDPRLAPFVAGYPEGFFSPSFHRACALADRYAEEWALEVAHRLGLERLSASTTPEGACRQLALEPAFARAARWILGTLAASGLAEATGSGAERKFRVPASLPEPDRLEFRAAALAMCPEVAPTFDLFDAAGAIYPEVARGEKQGDTALFGLGQASLWLRYFDNANPIYAINNLLAAHHAADVIAANPRPQTILELGAGAGSATLALLEELERRGLLDRVASYDATEPSSFFRRQAERRVPARFAQVPIRFRMLDMDVVWPERDGRPGYDVVFGVNVLHVARELAATLARVRDALEPGGTLVAGEAMRLHPDVPLASELIFSVLHGFTQVHLDADLRPDPGFLSPASWRRSLARAGFVGVTLAPDVEAIAPIFPRFAVGAITARSTPTAVA
jgi:SAM-dependent methyltransferase